MQPLLITKESLRPPRQRTRSSTHRTPTPQPPPEKQDGCEVEGETPLAQKSCRRWEQWSEGDQESFFQALAEHGKDYAKIRLFMKKKRKFKNDDDLKTNEQIKGFYYRTFLKISKMLSLQHEADPKKSCRREMHYMICLGELRKKGIHGFGEKVGKQLDELVTKGSTYVRFKGRNIRLRPPNRFLKKLYRDVNSIPDITLPKTINIELLPYSNSAFNYVQKHAFNPRLRFSNVSINAKFSEIFDMFDRRFSDLYTNENLNLLIYPSLPDDIDLHKFSEKLASAQETMESMDKKPETPIILEDALRNADEVISEDAAVEDDENFNFKIFGATRNAPEQSTPTNDFEGFWTYSTAEKVHLRTLFLSFGQSELLKFKYEWKLFEEQKPSFYLDSLDFLLKLAKHENLKKSRSVAKVKPKANVNPLKPLTPLTDYQNFKRIVPGVINDNILKAVRQPARKRPFTNFQKPYPVLLPQNKVQIEKNKVVSNAVAVNLVPQPQQLVRYANLPTQANNPLSPGKAPDCAAYEEVVLEEGCSDFKSLSDFLQSSTLASKDTLKTPVKQVKATSTPQSPNLDWLNPENADITLTESCFRNVCEMQALQEKKANNAVQSNVVQSGGKESIAKQLQGMEGSDCVKMLFDDSNQSLKAMVLKRLVSQPTDPTLPVFHTGDSSLGPLEGLSFELSNHAT